MPPTWCAATASRSDSLELDYLCSDLDRIQVARAVAASAAFPGPLTPIALVNHAGSCGFEEPAWIAETLAARGPSRRRLRQAQILRSYLERRSPYVHLLDGGISDNLGLRFGFEGVIEEGGLGKVLEHSGLGATREIVVIVVNAETESELRERSGWIAHGAHLAARHHLGHPDPIVQLRDDRAGEHELPRLGGGPQRRARHPGRIPPRRPAVRRGAGSNRAPLPAQSSDEALRSTVSRSTGCEPPRGGCCANPRPSRRRCAPSRGFPGRAPRRVQA